MTEFIGEPRRDDMGSKWICLMKQKVRHANGTEEYYHYATRPDRNRPTSNANAAYCIPIYHHDPQGTAIDMQPPKGDYIIFIRQPRPTIRRAAMEFVAGLLDEVDYGATTPYIHCAEREFREETPFEGKATDIHSEGFSSLGMTDENVAGVCLVAKPKNDEVTFCPQDYGSYKVVGDTAQDVDEAIDTYMVLLKDFPEYVEECKGRGELLDSRIASFCMAMKVIGRSATS